MWSKVTHYYSHFSVVQTEWESTKGWNNNFFYYQIKKIINLLLTEREGSAEKYWPGVVAVRKKRPRAS